LQVLRGEEADGDGCLAPDRQDLLLRLLERRKQAQLCSSSSGKRHAPLPPDFHVNIISNTSPKLQHTVAADGFSHSPASGASSYASITSSLGGNGDDAEVSVAFMLLFNTFVLNRHFPVLTLKCLFFFNQLVTNFYIS
jgi:hypothetical protein